MRAVSSAICTGADPWSFSRRENSSMISCFFVFSTSLYCPSIRRPDFHPGDNRENGGIPPHRFTYNQ